MSCVFFEQIKYFVYLFGDIRNLIRTNCIGTKIALSNIVPTALARLLQMQHLCQHLFPVLVRPFYAVPAKSVPTPRFCLPANIMPTPNLYECCTIHLYGAFVLLCTFVVHLCTFVVQKLLRDTRLYLFGDIFVFVYISLWVLTSPLKCARMGVRGAPFACGSLRHKIPTRKAILRMAKSNHHANAGALSRRLQDKERQA